MKSFGHLNLNLFSRDFNILIGEFDDDTLTGDSRRDVVLGLWGDDLIDGEAGSDLLLGGLGNDTLNGGIGDDTLHGGRGNDRFTISTNSGTDTVLDFRKSQDFLVLQDGLTFNQLAITQVGDDTQIRSLGSSQPTVLLKNVQASSLTAADFLTTPLTSSFTSLFVFGDSLSDPGNLFALTGNQFPPSPPYFNGRFSNGPIWADLLPNRLGLTPDQVSNFAVGGATTGRDNGLSPFLPPTLDLPGLRDEIAQFTNSLGNAGADPNGLYTLWAGSNDLFNLPNDPGAIPSVIATAVDNIATSIITLAQRGADSFLVANLPDLGLLPRSRSAGLSESATAISTAFNSALSTALSPLEQTLSIDIVEVDIFSLTRELATRPSEFGFTNVTDPLIQQVNPTNPNEFFFWDDTHPTARVHELIADVFQTTLFSAGYIVNGAVDDDLLSSAKAAVANGSIASDATRSMSGGDVGSLGSISVSSKPATDLFSSSIDAPNPLTLAYTLPYESNYIFSN